jgi:hypothetical protein
MTKTLRSTAVVFASLWVGILFCLGFVVAPYLFALAARNSPAVPNTGVAAELIGPLLYSSDVVGMVIGSALIVALVWLRRRNEVPLGSKGFISEIGVGVAVLCAVLNYGVFGPRLKAIQGELAARYGAFHQADKADPLYQQFSGLHQASTALFMAGFVAALVCLVCMTQFRSRAPVQAG